MAQLTRFSATAIGSPRVVSKMLPFQLGTSRLSIRDEDAEMGRTGPHSSPLDQDSDSGSTNYVREFKRIGPFTTTQDYFRNLYEEFRRPNRVEREPFDTGLDRMLEIMIDALPLVSQMRTGEDSTWKKEAFVLRHPNLNLDKVLIKEDGTVVGIIGWDNISTAPMCLGFASLPEWLTFDHCRLDFNRLCFLNPDADPEDSLSELQRLRRQYNHFISQYIGSDAEATINSHLFAALETITRRAYVAELVKVKLFRTCLRHNTIDGLVPAHQSEPSLIPAMDTFSFLDGTMDDRGEEMIDKRGDGTEAENGDSERCVLNENGERVENTTSRLEGDWYLPRWIEDLIYDLAENKVPDGRIRLIKEHFARVLASNEAVEEALG